MGKENAREPGEMHFSYSFHNLHRSNLETTEYDLQIQNSPLILQILHDMRCTLRLEWLEDILAIAHTGSFSGAAERRNLTQSAFSRRIKQIEEFVGLELFDRSRKPVQLRPTTEAQRAQVEQIAAALRQLVLDLRHGDRVASNRIVIASQHSLTTSLAPRIIQGIHVDGEEVYVRLRSANLDECLGLLLSRQVDLAIVYSLAGGEEPSGDFLEAIDIRSDRLIPVLRSDLVPELLRKIPQTELPYIAYPSDVFFGQIMANRILPALDPRTTALPRAETALTLAALEMAIKGLAVAWVPETLAQAATAQGRTRGLSPALPSCGLTIRAIRLRRERSQAEEVIWDHILALRESEILSDPGPVSA
jgi:DNA-binding transcriptional LysR family regulator